MGRRQAQRTESPAVRSQQQFHPNQTHQLLDNRDARLITLVLGDKHAVNSLQAIMTTAATQNAKSAKPCDIIKALNK